MTQIGGSRTPSEDRRAWQRKPWLTTEKLYEALLYSELVERGEAPQDEGLKPLSLAEFVKTFWHELEPTTPLLWGWALDAMAMHLEAAARRQIMKLIINVPPGTSKSTMTNVFFPAWVWAEVSPSERFLAVAFSEDLSLRDSLAMRRLVESNSFKERYGEKVRLMHDQNAKGRYDTTARGRRLTKPLLSATGERAGILLVDDPNNATEIKSRVKRQAVNNAYDTSLRMRGANPKTFVQVVVQQRLHEEDLTGHLINKGSGWVVLRLPEEYEPEAQTVTHLDDGSLFWKDPRTERGALLFEEYRDRAAVNSMKADLGSFGSASQLQQRPVPEGGGIVKLWWWAYHAPAELIDYLPPIYVNVVLDDGSVEQRLAPVVPTPAEFDLKLTSWDMSFKDTSKSDFVVGQAWGLSLAEFYLLDQVRGRMSYVKARSAVQAFADKHEDIDLHLIEDKANGPAIISDMRSAIAGLIAVEPQGSKESRVSGHTPSIEAGNVFLPHPNLPGFGWVADYLTEFGMFPSGSHDDQIDATTQALARFKTVLRLKRKDATRKRSVMPVTLGGLDTVGGEKVSRWKR